MRCSTPGSGKLTPDVAQGGRYWSNYTWHGDQNPSNPWWCGAQASDIDMSDMRFSKLCTSWGKNFVENKMPEAHWKLESIERGARIVVITPEYNPTAYRADYWIPLRPNSDASIFLGACKIIIDENMHDIDFLKQFTDSPLLVRTDTLQYLDPRDVIEGLHFPGFLQELLGPRANTEVGTDSAAGRHDGLGPQQKQAVPLNREQVGYHFEKSGIDAALTGTYRVKLSNGREVDVMPIWQMYMVHFQDFDLDTVHQITRAPKDLLVRYARDSGTIKPAAIHNGEGTNHYFHMTTNSRAAAMVLHHYRATSGSSGPASIPGLATTRRGYGAPTPWSGGGLAVHTGEDPFNITLDPNAHGKEIKTKSYYYGEEVGYWNHGDTALIVITPKYGRKVFTGKTHMPSPTKLRWVTNVNVLNNAKHHYDMVRNVDPSIEMIVTQDIEMTSDVNHADIALACNSWMEFTYPEMTATVSNPWFRSGKAAFARCTTPATISTPLRAQPRSSAKSPGTSGCAITSTLSIRTASMSMCNGCWMPVPPLTATARTSC